MDENGNIIIEEVEFNQALYDKNIKENTFNVEYEEGDENANNKS